MLEAGDRYLSLAFVIAFGWYLLTFCSRTSGLDVFLFAVFDLLPIFV